MQNIIKGFFQNLVGGTSKVTSAAAAPNSATKKCKNQRPKGTRNPNDDGYLDMDKCFEIGYKCVSRATNEFMKTLSKLHGRQDSTNSMERYCKWNALLEEMLVCDISKHYPKHHFITRIKHRNRLKVRVTDEPTWFIDPIHGGTNFMHAFPYTVIKLAFWMYNQPRFSIIWNPLLDLCYTARLGFGAHMNVEPLHVSKRTELSDALIMHELRTTSDSDTDEYRSLSMDCLETLAKSVHGLRSLGCTTSNMCMVAHGCADAYFDFNCPSWDMSASILLVKEAGGVVLDPSLAPFDLHSRRVLCASTMELAQKLSEILHSEDPSNSDSDNGSHRNSICARRSKKQSKNFDNNESHSNFSSAKRSKKDSTYSGDHFSCDDNESHRNCRKPRKDSKYSEDLCSYDNNRRKDSTEDDEEQHNEIRYCHKDHQTEMCEIREQSDSVKNKEEEEELATPKTASNQQKIMQEIPKKQVLEKTNLKKINHRAQSVLCASPDKLSEKEPEEPQNVHVEITAEPTEVPTKPPKDETLQRMGFGENSQEIESTANTQQNSSKDKLVKTKEKVLEIPTNSALQIYPHFQISMKYSGTPRKILECETAMNPRRATIATIDHPTDPNLPGQGSMF